LQAVGPVGITAAFQPPTAPAAPVTAPQQLAAAVAPGPQQAAGPSSIAALMSGLVAGSTAASQQLQMLLATPEGITSTTLNTLVTTLVSLPPPAATPAPPPTSTPGPAPLPPASPTPAPPPVFNPINKVSNN
jgi:hypothetical protein